MDVFKSNIFYYFLVLQIMSSKFNIRENYKRAQIKSNSDQRNSIEIKCIKRNQMYFEFILPTCGENFEFQLVSIYFSDQNNCFKH